jgi:hypothetical protein
MIAGVRHMGNAGKGESRMFCNDYELKHYVLKALGVSRKGLNIICFIGIFIFGWLLAVVFDSLGRGKQGWWFYVVPMMVCLFISINIAPAFGIIVPIIYIIGWIHANAVLSGYQSSARNCIGIIDRLSENELTADAVMEKGILQIKVLAAGEAGASTLAKAIQMPGGDAQLLNLSGVVLFRAKHFAEAKQFFVRALSTSKEDVLTRNIKLNLTKVEKKLV